MRKIAIKLGVVMMLLFATAIPLQAESDASTFSAAVAVENIAEAETENLVERIEYIKDMDKSDMTFSEKRELRKEVRAINKELKQRPYIYISGSALLIILIILLLL